MTSEPRVLVCLACYNERDNLAALMAEILERVPTCDILVIDDNSPDGTGVVADEAAARDSRIHVLHRPGKLGLGTACLAGIRYSIEHDYDYFLNMDADFSHPPRNLPAVLGGMADHDVMIGSRYVPGGGIVNWPWSRHLISRSINTLTRWMLWVPARDMSGAYRCYRVALLKRVRLDNFLSHGYSFQQEVLFRCWKAGARIGETPITFENRRAGASKADLREMARSLFCLFRVGLLALFGRRDFFVVPAETAAPSPETASPPVKNPEAPRL